MTLWVKRVGRRGVVGRGRRDIGAGSSPRGWSYTNLIGKMGLASAFQMQEVVESMWTYDFDFPYWCLRCVSNSLQTLLPILANWTYIEWLTQNPIDVKTNNECLGETSLAEITLCRIPKCEHLELQTWEVEPIFWPWWRPIDTGQRLNIDHARWVKHTDGLRVCPSLGEAAGPPHIVWTLIIDARAGFSQLR